MLMGLDDAAVNELPLHIWIASEGFKNRHEFFAARTLIEAFINLIPVAKVFRDISPRPTYSETIQNGHYSESK